MTTLFKRLQVQGHGEPAVERRRALSYRGWLRDPLRTTVQLVWFLIRFSR